MQEPHFVECQRGWLAAAGEAAACVPDLRFPTADNKLVAVKVEPHPEIGSENVQEADMSIVKEEYEMKEVSVYPSTDQQLIVKVKDEPQPYTYPFEEELDLNKVKEKVEINSAGTNEMNNDQYQIPVEDFCIDVLNEPSANIKSEIFIEEHAHEQLVADLKEEKNVENVAVLTGALVESSHLMSQSHTERRPFFCSICNNRFTDGDLESHLLDVHSAVRPYKCPVCESTFMWLSDIQNHECSETSGKPFSCLIPDENFRTSVDVPMDQQIHHGDTPITCSVCGRNFKNKWNLKQHEKLHTEKKQCSICWKEFRWLYQLKKHEGSHNDTRVFQCSDCGKAFKVLTQLMKHQKTHIDSRPYLCSICGRTFKKSIRLRRHKKEHKGDK
ncbi:zinc finger protein 718 [Anabrus simplex]|uniref:zinc finger protein 718 n=1 Tax=Anabrus simplex TaxID=316456 RepID=UPI0035A32843